MRVRERACLWMQHHERSVLALGLFGMLGFVVASLGAVSGLLGARTYLAGAAGSLLAYAAALVIGALGDPFELSRNR